MSVEEQGLSRAQIKRRLAKLSKTELLDMVMERCDEDEEFDAQLQARFIIASPKPKLGQLKHSIRGMIGDYDPYDYHSSPDYDAVISLLTKVARNPAEADMAIELTEFAMDVWEEQIQYVDDSNGEMGEVLAELHTVHLAACKKAKPDGEALAERLITRAISSPWEMFYEIYHDYRNVFKLAGRKRYQEVLEKAWNKLPQGVSDPQQRYDNNGSRLDTFMLEVAQSEGDVDKCVAILSRDLSYSYSYLRIGEVLVSANRLDEAISWGERGLKVGSYVDSRVRRFLAECYQKTGQPDRSMTMLWDNFVDSPTMDTFKEMCSAGKKLKKWKPWRKQIDGHLLDQIQKKKCDGSLLVEILLFEKDLDAAWTCAQSYGCRNHLWVTLAKKREKAHPHDAVAVYQQQVPYLVSHGNNSSYNEAIRFIDNIWKLLSGSKPGQQEFTQWIRSLTQIDEIKRKRNFMAGVRRRPWGKEL